MNQQDFYSLVKSNQNKAKPSSLSYEDDQESDDIPDFYSFARPSRAGDDEFEIEEEVPDFYSLVRPEEEPKEHFYDELIQKLTPKPYVTEKTSPEKSLRQNVLDIYRPEEKTAEQLKAMSLEERMQYAQDLKNLRELQSATGFAKGALSGLTFSASEHIPGLKPDEDDLMVGLGETVGSFLPIAKLYNFIGKPLVSLAAKSPVARQGLMALARMTGFGLTGATYEGAKDLVQGEIPSPTELAKTGAEWAAIDAVLQTLGVGVAFNSAVRRIAAEEGVPAKEVLKKLWDATRRKLKRPISPSEITQVEVDALLNETIKAEQEGFGKVKPEEEFFDIEFEEPIAKEAKPEIEPEIEIEAEKPKEEIIEKPKRELSIPENAVLTKPESISVGARGGKGVATVPVRKIGDEGKEYFAHEEIPVTKEEQQLIDASNAWDKVGDHKESSELANQARQMIFDRLKDREIKELVSKALETPKTALKDIPKEIYRGYGREKKEAIYGQVGEPILGEGKYYAFSETEAKEFGPKVEQKNIDLQNPLVIKNDSEWRSFTKKAGLEFPNPVAMNEQETISNIQKLRNALEKEGYDGTVVWFPETAGDFNDNVESIKTIRNVFGIPQVFEMPKPTKAKFKTEGEISPKIEKAIEDYKKEFSDPTKEAEHKEKLKKEEWKYTKNELKQIYRGVNPDITEKNLDLILSTHEGKVKRAVERGEEVPEEVLESYDITKPKMAEKPVKELSEAEIIEQINSFPAPPGKPQKLNPAQIIDSVPANKWYLVKDALSTMESILDKKAAEVDIPKLREMQKQLIKYIQTTDFDKPELLRRTKALEAKLKVFKNSLKKREGILEKPLLSASEKYHPKTEPLKPVVGKKQAVARSKIIDLFRKAFKDPIRLGKFKQRALGIHKMWPRVSRLLKANDIETAAHEIGHNLHTVLYGGDAKTAQEQRANVIKALKPYLGELQQLAGYEPYELEGFAEFTRLYVTNPDVAEELAPNFYYKFMTDLDAQYPELNNALLQARDYYEQYLQGTPQSRIRAQTNYAQDKGKLANIVDSVKKYLDPDFLKTQLLDDVFPAKRLVAEAFGIPLTEVENLKDERNLYRALRVLKGAVGKGDVFVLHETFDAKTLDKTGGSLRDILKQLPDEESYRAFNDYLIARRTLEKSSQQIETGINIGDALAVEAELRPRYGDLAKELDKYNDSLLKYAVDSGLLSGEQYGLIKKNNVLYTPFQRVMEPEKGGIAAGGGRLQAGKPIKRMVGSSRDIIAPIESIIKNTYSIIINSEKNLAGQVLAKIAQMKGTGGYVEHVPTPTKVKAKIEGEQVAKELAERFEAEGLNDLIEYNEKGKPVLREDIAQAIPEVFLRFGAGRYPAGENIVTVYDKGKPKYYEVSPDIFEMWQKGMEPYTANLLTKILRIPAKTLRAGAILNPRFMQKNLVRDTWGGYLFTKYGKSIKDPKGLFIDTIYSPLAMFATAARKGPLYVEWLKSGGGMSTMQSLDRDSVVKKLEEIRYGTKPYQVIKWMKKVGEMTEEMNRLSEFGRALEVEGKTRLGREIAAYAARDLSIDFAKIGLQTKVLNQIIPFWNATIQGGDKFLRTIANPKDRKSFLPRIIGFITLPSLILAWLNKDDERVKEFYEEEKDFNFITFVGDTAIKIPVPFETGVIFHGLTQRMFNHFMKEDPEAFEGFMGSVWSAMAPGFTPALANPFIETYANKNFFTGARIIPGGKEGLISKYQYKNYTSTVARLIGRAMNYMVGEETRSKAASPAVIDHFINSWTGGLGKMIIGISDYSLESAGLSDKIPGPQQTITERLDLDAFVARYPRANTRSIEKFYDNYADATARQKSLKFAEKMDLETEEERGAAYQRFEKIFDYNSLKHAYKAIQNCQREINNIYNDPSISTEEKKEFIDKLYLQMIDFAKDCNEDIRQYRLLQEKPPEATKKKK